MRPKEAVQPTGWASGDTNADHGVTATVFVGGPLVVLGVWLEQDYILKSMATPLSRRHSPAVQDFLSIAYHKCLDLESLALIDSSVQKETPGLVAARPLLLLVPNATGRGHLSHLQQYRAHRRGSILHQHLH